MVNYMAMKSRPQQKVVYVLRRHIDAKSSKDHVSGILRFTGNHPEWYLRLITVPNARAILPRLLSDRPNGIIGVHISEDGALAELGNTPFVTIDAKGQDICHTSVCIDDQAIAHMACDLFQRRHFVHLAYVGTHNPVHLAHSLAREKAMRDFATDTGMTFTSFAINLGPRNIACIDKLAKELRQLPLPCGVLAFNDAASRIVLDSAHLANLKVPDQISIIGVDNDTSICENMRPTLSSILPDLEQSGFIAAQTLDDMMCRSDFSRRVITYGPRTLIERESTQDTHGSARIATTALQVIRQDSRGKTKISEMAKELNVSSRFLEMRFRSVFGKSMRDERTNLRLEQAKELLMTTDKPLYEISALCGGDRFASFAALFKRNVGMTMSAFRKQNKGL